MLTVSTNSTTHHLFSNVHRTDWILGNFFISVNFYSYTVVKRNYSNVRYRNKNVSLWPWTKKLGPNSCATAAPFSWTACTVAQSVALASITSGVPVLLGFPPKYPARGPVNKDSEKILKFPDSVCSWTGASFVNVVDSLLAETGFSFEHPK